MKISLDKITNDWAGGMAQAVQYLTHKHKALSSNPSTAEKKKNYQ
jgi:hypothetical protein